MSLYFLLISLVTLSFEGKCGGFPFDISSISINEGSSTTDGSWNVSTTNLIIFNSSSLLNPILLVDCWIETDNLFGRTCSVPQPPFVNDSVGVTPRSLVDSGVLTCSLSLTTFDFVDFGTASVISDQIQTSIENFEPRIENLQVQVFPRPDRNEFEVNVIFDIVGLEFPTQGYSFLLEATR